MRGSTHRSGSTARTTARIVLPDGSPLSRASDEEQIWISHMISSDEEQIWISHMISSDEEQIWISHMISDEEQIWISHMISDPGLMKELVREDDAVDVTKQRPSSSFTVDLHSRPSLPPRRHAAAGVELCERLATRIRACTTHSSSLVASFAIERGQPAAADRIGHMVLRRVEAHRHRKGQLEAECRSVDHPSRSALAADDRAQYIRV